VWVVLWEVLIPVKYMSLIVYCKTSFSMHQINYFQKISSLLRCFGQFFSYVICFYENLFTVKYFGQNKVVLTYSRRLWWNRWLKAAFETSWLCSWTMFVISRVSPSLQRTLIDIGHFIWNVLKKGYCKTTYSRLQGRLWY
jgi:hypothetical protein